MGQMGRWRLVLCAVALVLGLSLIARAGEPAGKSEPGPVERIGESLKETGKSIEENVKGAIKKIEDEHLAEKIENKVKETVKETVEGIEKTGKAIEKKLNP